jgi:hypothetical protein
VAKLEALAINLGCIHMYELQCDDISNEHGSLQGRCMNETRTGTMASSNAKSRSVDRKRVGRILRTMYGQDAKDARC